MFTVELFFWQAENIKMGGNDAEVLLQRLSAATSAAKVLEELGYVCTATKEQLVEI